MLAGESPVPRDQGMKMNEFGDMPLAIDAKSGSSGCERLVPAPMPGAGAWQPGWRTAANDLCVRSDGERWQGDAKGGRLGRVSAKQIVEALEDAETFAEAASHDLRAPMRQMRGYVALIVSSFGDELPREAVELLERVDGVARRMDALLQALGVMSGVSRRRVRFAWCALSAIAASVLEHLGEQSPGRVVSVKIEPHLRVRADAWLVRTLLENLLGNAWKFSSRVDHAEIEFGRTEHGGRSWFYVRDNGAGFDMQYAGTLFEPFHRLHSQREFEGTGLGLAIAQRIIQRHGGSIRGESEPGKGAVFYFTLE